MRKPLALGAIAAAFALAIPGSAAVAGTGIPLSGTGTPRTGDFTSSSGAITESEFATPENEDAPDAYNGTVSLTTIKGVHGTTVTSAARAKSSATFKNGFAGLNFYQQRYARGGNQFSVEPPDQGMCAGNGYVLEAVNDVLNVFDTNGTSQLPDNTATNIVAGFPRDVNHAVDLNSFFGYAPAINRSTGVRAQNVTDPSCLYDAATQRWFVTVLTLEVTPGGAFTLANHIDVAVSQTSDPTGSWNIYRNDVTNDGTPFSVPADNCPCLGDYPHIGADANGFYVTTNAYPWNGNDFNGAQIYAYSKAQLAAGSATVTMQHIDTSGMVHATSPVAMTQPGFTVWPAQSPTPASFQLANNGTEYFLSSNAADEAAEPNGNGTSTNLIAWTLSNTASLNTATPALSLSNRVLTVGRYGIPPKQRQQGAGTLAGTVAPQGHCINDTTTATIAGVGCWRLLLGREPAHDEVISTPDSNDTRMQQVMYANGKLWGALDTAVSPTGSTSNRAGIAWYVVNPSAGRMVMSGYLGASGYDFTYPAIGVTASGRGVMGFTASGDSLYPSAAYAPIDASAGVGAWGIVPGAQGNAPADGFTSYKAQVGSPPRTRWGDYGAAAVVGNDVWLASEWVQSDCSYTDWGGPFFVGGTGDNLLGTCGGASHGPGTRAALGNWSTYISRFTP